MRPARSQRHPTAGNYLRRATPGDERAPDMFTQSTLDMFNVDFSPENRHYF